MEIKKAVEWVLSKARINAFEKPRYTKHPGSKKRKHKKKIRAAQKRAKMSRKRNRYGK